MDHLWLPNESMEDLWISTVEWECTPEVWHTFWANFSKVLDMLEVKLDQGQNFILA